MNLDDFIKETKTGEENVAELSKKVRENLLERESLVRCILSEKMDMYFPKEIRQIMFDREEKTGKRLEYGSIRVSAKLSRDPVASFEFIAEDVKPKYEHALLFEFTDDKSVLINSRSIDCETLSLFRSGFGNLYTPDDMKRADEYLKRYERLADEITNKIEDAYDVLAKWKEDCINGDYQTLEDVNLNQKMPNVDDIIGTRKRVSIIIEDAPETV